MNINQLIFRIKNMSGMNGTLKGIISDKKIRDIIIDVALPLFNQYHGFTLNVTLDLIIQAWDESEYARMTYGRTLDVEMKIPESITSKITFYGSEIKNIKMDPIPLYLRRNPSTGLKTDMINWQVGEINRINSTPTRPLFRQPDILIIPEYARGSYRAYQNFKVHLTCTHPRNLSTISSGIARHFEELCSLVVKTYIWNNVLAVTRADIGAGQIDASTFQTFQNAEAELAEYKAILKTKAAYDQMEIIYRN